MKSLMHWIRSLVLIFMILSNLNLSVLAQVTVPGLDKIANKKLDDYRDKVKDIRDKTTDPEAREKQIKKNADEAIQDDVKFIEDAGGKMFIDKEQIDKAAAEYVNGLRRIFEGKYICPLLAKLVGPGGRYKDTLTEEWSALRRLYEDFCKDSPAVKKPPGGIRIGGGDPGGGNTPGGGGIPISDGGPCPEGYPLLEDCVKEHNLKVCLYGDGQTTSNCTLSVTDQSGHTSTAQLKTVCASPKSLTPPVSKDKAEQQNLTYTVVTGKNPTALSLVNTAKELEKQGKFNDVSLNPEKRCSTISQLAIWKDIGGSSPGNKDSITHESIKKDMLHKSGVNPKTLTKEENKQLTNRIDAICAAVDLTLKECPETKNKTTDKHSYLVPNGSSLNILVAYHQPRENPKLAQVKVANGHCCIPKGTVFVPNDKNQDKYQEIMCVEDQAFPCPPGISDGQIADNCNWIFFRQLVLPKNPYDPTTQGIDYDKFENEQATRITEELAKLAEKEADLVDEDEPAPTTDKFKESNIILLYLCVDKTGHAHSAKHAVVPEAQKKNWDPEGDLDTRKARKDARKQAVKDNRPKSE